MATRNVPSRVERKVCTLASFNKTIGLNPIPKSLGAPARNLHLALPAAPPGHEQPSAPGGVPYTTFRTGSCTKAQLRELKRRLVSELQLVRSLRARLDSLGPPQPKTEEKQRSKRGRKPGFKLSKTRNPNPDKALTLMMKKCGLILAKIMKQKSAWVFNKPVDVAGLNLFDYHCVIKNPMDLGTVKSNLTKGVYTTPLSFAADVRLTFSNAMTYNPRDHGVHLMAAKLLTVFNEMFDPTYRKYEEERSGLKMTYEERARLGRELEGLPEEMVGELIEIVGRRNGNVAKRDGHEIEIDFEIMDEETLWELHQFIGKCKTMTKQQLVNNSVGKMEMGQKEGVGQEEVVDIGEEAPLGTYPPVVIEKDASGTSRSSSSFCSFGTDSGSDSDSAIAKSPYVEVDKT